MKVNKQIVFNKDENTEPNADEPNEVIKDDVDKGAATVATAAA